MNIFQSKESYINWVVDNYHAGVVNNAISAGLITSDVPREELYYVLVNAMESGGMNQVMYALDVPLNLKGQSQEVRTQFARAVPRPMASSQLPDFCDPNFIGPLSPEQQSAMDSGACNTGSFWGEDGFTIDDLGSLFNTAASVFTNIWGAFGPTDNGNNTAPPPPNPDLPEDNTNMILIIAALITVIIVVVLLTRKK
jgi:hypothetical protein